MGKLLAGFILAVEIKLDLDVVRIAEKNLPTRAIWHLFTIKGAGLNEMPVGASGQRPEICIADGSFAQPFLTTISRIVKCLGTSRLTAALLERLANEPHVRLFFYTDDNVRFTGRKPYGMKSAAAPWPCWNGGMS